MVLNVCMYVYVNVFLIRHKHLHNQLQTCVAIRLVTWHKVGTIKINNNNKNIKKKLYKIIMHRCEHKKAHFFLKIIVIHI